MKYSQFKKTRVPKYNKTDMDRTAVKGFYITLTLVLWVLRKDYDFGSKRIGDFIDKVSVAFHDLNEYFTIEDVESALKDEVGIDIVLDDVFTGVGI
ncbi:MAG: hypothetical protein SPI59_03200 [Finegoldia sp.]|nr:hypothetical protein [Finegoldia sp.]